MLGEYPETTYIETRQNFITHVPKFSQVSKTNSFDIVVVKLQANFVDLSYRILFCIGEPICILYWTTVCEKMKITSPWWYRKFFQFLVDKACWLPLKGTRNCRICVRQVQNTTLYYICVIITHFTVVHIGSVSLKSALKAYISRCHVFRLYFTPMLPALELKLGLAQSVIYLRK